MRDAPALTPELLRPAKRHGFSDAQIGEIRVAATRTSSAACGTRSASGPVFKTVDTCAGEFAARTPVPLLVVRRGDRGRAADQAGGAHPRQRAEPDRAGHRVRLLLRARAMALRDAGFETVMVNCNPETVSTDYDTSDRLYFEPLTLEDVLEVVHAEQQAGPVAGVVVQLGGQTPLGLAQALADAGVPIVGTSPEAIHLAEDRGAFGRGARRGRPAGAQARHGDVVRRAPSRSPTRSATRCWCGRRTCSAAAAWRSSTTTRRSSRYIGRADRDLAGSTRCWSTASSTTRSRSTSTRSTTARSSTSAA